MSYDVKEEFGKFIETRGITNRVLKFVSDKGCSFEAYLRNTPPTRFIDGLGSWRSFREGHDYWSEMNSAWRNIYKNRLEIIPKGIKSIW